MTKLLLGTFALAALIAGPAVAADMPVRAPIYKAAPALAAVYNWTGFYVGVNAGGAWGTFHTTTSTVDGPVPGADYFSAGNVAGVNAAGIQSIKSSTFTGGGQAGYNWRMGNFVVGIEADFQSFHLSGSASTTAIYPASAPFTFTINSAANTDWLFTARPRLGIANNNWLFYVTGGVAVTNLKGQFAFFDNSANESASFSKTKAGYTVGGGIEAGLWGGWTLKAEYLHVNFGTVSTTSTNLVCFDCGGIVPYPVNVFTHSVELKANIARVGINYRFGHPTHANY